MMHSLRESLRSGWTLTLLMLNSLNSPGYVVHYGSNILVSLKKKRKKDINTFIQWECFVVIKSDSEDIYNVMKDFYFK